ncbi:MULTISPECIES: CHAT domain-containing protein [Sorangium]|uniref:Uncharacterized protein n=1 Tax=Sorangium cellulosum TaxID=56 RepID=A0A4P2QGV1_SORCE|nr:MULTISPECIES: CHAT domain-containing protein [Sorangium]AUX29114.1 uncharacterized protein SOCE836_012010 [Sorangium cellulosum]WCQ88505.1 hypothetical protein NQZ70_01183 [Sorangium sp. Soce836]
MHLTLELTRTDRPDEAFLSPEGATDYVLRTEGGGAETATLDWSRELHADLDAVRRPGRDPAVVQRLGNRLRKFLAPAGWARHEAAIAAAVERGEPVRITLRASAAELYGLPWELLALKATGQHLGELPDVLLRYAWPDSRTRPEEPSPLPEGGRLLVGWSAAAGGVPLRPHLDAIGSAAARGDHPFDPERDVLEHLSVDRLAGALDDAARSGRIVTVLHLLCHGGAAGQSYGLCWDADDGSGDRVLVDAGRLRQILAPHAGRVRLVVLSACDSGNAGHLGNHLGSVAQNLHQAGVQAVIASRFPLSAEGSARFSETFYQALLAEPASVERAFLAGRRRLARDPQSLDWAALTLYARPEDGDDSRPVAIRPYRGLLAFQPAHSRFFVGRDAERDEALSDLAALREGGKPRLLVVAGASGTGKSSVVLAGVVPALLGAEREPARGGDEVEALQRTVGRLAQLLGDKGKSTPVQQALQTLAREAAALAGAAAGRWEVAVFRPGADPTGALEAALERRARRARPDAPFLLVVDQLEEIFTHTADPAARQAFAARLWGLAREPGGPSVIATLRVDFLGQCGEILLDPEAGLRLDSVAYDEAHRVFVAQMKPAQLRDVVEEPARRVGLELDPGLAARMIADVGAEPGALPLLEYTLDLLWQRRAGRALSSARYEELGGVFGALESMADRVLDGLDEAQQEAARRLLPRLVGVGDGSAGDTRQRVPLARLLPADPGQRARWEEVLARFVDARLLTRGEEAGEVVVEVAHEALIRRWKRLGAWLAEDRGRLGELAKIERWALDWKGHGAPLQGAQLGYARQFREQQAEALSAAALEMIAASEQAERERLEAEKKKQEGERRRLRQIAAAAVVTAAAMLVLGSVAVVAHQRAEQKAQEAAQKTREAEEKAQEAARSDQRSQDALHLAAASNLYGKGQYAWALSVLLRVSEGGRRDLWTGLAQRLLVAPVPRALLGHTGGVQDIAWSPDGQLVATGAADGTVKIWTPAGELRASLEHGSRVEALAWSPKGDRLVTGAYDGKVRLWNPSVSGKTPLVARDRHEAAVTAVAWSRDGELVASGSADMTVALWRARGPAQLAFERLVGKERDRHAASVVSVAFSRDSRRLVSASHDRTARVWDLQGAAAPAVLRHRSLVYSARFSADGARIVTASANEARVWGADGSGPRLVLRGHEADVSSAAWSPDDAWIVTGSDDNTARLWSAGDGAPIAILRDHAANVSAVDVISGRRGGLRIATGSWDATADIWRLDRFDLPIFTRPAGRAGTDALALVTWSPDGSRALTATSAGKLQVWSHGNREGPLALPGEVRDLSAAAFDGSGRRLVVASASAARIWDLDAPSRSPSTLAGRSGPISLVALSPDGRRVVIASGDTAEVWEPAAPQRPITFRAEEGNVTYAAWSDDGTRLLTASGGVAEVWELAAPSRSPALVLHHPRPVLAAAFAGSGDRIATAAGAATYLWGARGDLEGVHLEHDGAVVSVRFAPKDDVVVAVAGSGGVRACATKAPYDCPFAVAGGEARASRAFIDGAGTHLVILGTDGIKRTWDWITKPEALARRLAEEDAGCLPAEVRRSYLEESEDTAKGAYEACRKAEASRRAPAPDRVARAEP